MGKVDKTAIFACTLAFIAAAAVLTREVGAATDTKTGTTNNSFNSSISEGNQSCVVSCSSGNSYAYTFDYERDLSGSGDWSLLGDGNVNKCDPIKVKFSAIGSWGNALNKDCTGQTPVTATLPSPTLSTDILACLGQDDCLSKTAEYSLTPETWGKGVQKVPADFVAQTEKSLTSSNPYLKCVNGICVSYTSGSFPLTAAAPASSYFGQCRGYGATVNTPEAAVPAVSSNTVVTIANRPPVPTVSFEKNPIAPNEEVNVTCDIVDPDECSDKITKVKWTCADSNGNSNNCFVWKEQTGQFTAGGAVQDLVSSEQNNPYRATAKFKATQTGNYAVTCEATDNDANNPLTGTGINGITVVQSCAADGICNSSCPSDPDCAYGVIPAHNGYCAVISPGGGGNNQLCGKNRKVDYEAYYSGIDPTAYRWKCSADAPVTETADPKIACSYGDPGSYLPSLSIVDKNGTETGCVTQTSTTVVGEGNGSCQLEIRPAGTGDDFASKLTRIKAQDQIEAKIDRTCVSGGATKWTVTGGSAVNQNSGSALVEFNAQGAGSIKAEITTPDGKTYDCGTVNVKVSEEVQWR